MRLVYTIFLASLFLASCGPAAKLRRAERLIKKAESQGASWKSDTVFIDVPVIVPEIHVDTLLNYRNFRDTITVIKKGIITKLKVDTINKTVYVSTKCPEQKVIAKAPVIVHKTIKADTWLKWWHLLVAFCFGYIVRSVVKVP